MPELSTEVQFLVFCARAELAQAQRERLREISSGENFDWDYLYRLARRHSLVPLVYRQLETSLKQFIPAEVLQRFRKDYQENAARNVVLTDELISLIHLLADEGIEAIAFKGPALAVMAYGDLNLRRFVDLDLMVTRADMRRAIDILRERGYATAKSLNEAQMNLLSRTQHNLQFTRGQIILELHWQVASHLFASTVTAEELWQHLETVEINGHPVKTLAAEDLLFALCVHGSRHVWQRLAWICDLDRIVRTQTHINWEKLLRRARNARAERMFLLGLALSQDLLGTTLPAVVADAIARDSRIPQLVNDIEQRLFDGPDQRELGFRTIFRFNFLIRQDWLSRLRYCAFVLAPSDSDLETLRLSKSLLSFYYLIRPLRLLRLAIARRSQSAAAGPQN